MRLGKSAMIAIGIALGLAAVSTSAGAGVVTFDDLPGSGLVPSPYGGINWDDNWAYYDNVQDPYNPASPPTRIYTNYDKYPGAAFASVPFYFLADAVFNGAYVSGLGSFGSISFSLFNNGVLVLTTAPYDPTNIPTFVASGFSGLVDEVRVNGNAGYYVLDDVTFDAAPVPEPASLLLLTTGLAGLALRRRRS